MDALMEIIVNGKRKPWVSLSITGEQVITLAFGLFKPFSGTVYTITYAHGENGAQGSLLPNDKVKAMMNMIFNVSATDQA